MQESLFLLPDNFDSDLLYKVERYIDDPEILFVAGDLADDLWFEEYEAVSILGNYGQIEVIPSQKRYLDEVITSHNDLRYMGVGAFPPEATF